MIGSVLEGPGTAQSVFLIEKDIPSFLQVLRFIACPYHVVN